MHYPQNDQLKLFGYGLSKNPIHLRSKRKVKLRPTSSLIQTHAQAQNKQVFISPERRQRVIDVNNNLIVENLKLEQDLLQL